MYFAKDFKTWGGGPETQLDVAACELNLSRHLGSLERWHVGKEAELFIILRWLLVQWSSTVQRQFSMRLNAMAHVFWFFPFQFLFALPIHLSQEYSVNFSSHNMSDVQLVIGFYYLFFSPFASTLIII